MEELKHQPEKEKAMYALSKPGSTIWNIFFEYSKYIHMKKIIIAGFLFASFQLKVQLLITPGAELYMSGNAQLTLQNIDLVNNGLFNYMIKYSKNK